MARPRSLSKPDEREALLQLIRTGVPVVHAARACRVSQDTVERECARDEGFAESLREAEATAVSVALGLIQKAAAGGSWQAAAWFLERRHTKDFGRRDRVEAEIKPVTEFSSVDERIEQLIQARLTDGS